MIKIIFVTVTVYANGMVEYVKLPIIAPSVKVAIEMCNARVRQNEFTYVETDPKKVITGWFCEPKLAYTCTPSGNGQLATCEVK